VFRPKNRDDQEYRCKDVEQCWQQQLRPADMDKWLHWDRSTSHVDRIVLDGQPGHRLGEPTYSWPPLAPIAIYSMVSYVYHILSFCSQTWSHWVANAWLKWWMVLAEDGGWTWVNLAKTEPTRPKYRSPCRGLLMLTSWTYDWSKTRHDDDSLRAFCRLCFRSLSS